MNNSQNYPPSLNDDKKRPGEFWWFFTITPSSAYFSGWIGWLRKKLFKKKPESPYEITVEGDTTTIRAKDDE